MDYQTKFSSVKKLYPHYKHIQGRKGPISMVVYPTNACNLNCTFCVNSERDKREKLTVEEILATVSSFTSLKAIEISGGGEPTTWKPLPKLIEELHKRNLDVGLVTNGFNLGMLRNSWQYISWVRISLNGLVDHGQEIDFYSMDKGPTYGLSYVIGDWSNKFYLDTIRSLMKEHKLLSYARLTHDILEEPDKDYYEDLGDGIYIFDRKWEKTLGWCYVGSIKPVLAADGNLFQCCILCNKDREYRKDQIIHYQNIRNYDSFKCDMKKCTMNEKNKFIKEAIEHNDPHINFV